MRVALFSDVHGNLSALEAVLAALPGHGRIDATVCAGDLVFLGASPAAVVDTLVAAGVQLLRGNADDLVTGQLPLPEAVPADRPDLPALLAAHIEWNRGQLGEERLALLRQLPLTRHFAPAPAERLVVCHATPQDNNSVYPGLKHPAAELRQAYAPAEARAVAFGHWHRPGVALLGDLALVNVACVSLPEDGQALAGYTIAEWHDDFWSFRQFRVPYDLAPEVERMRQRGMPRPPWPRV